MSDGLKRRWQRATQLSYLSPFERRLNRSLWALACVALSYCIAQHVLLANVPEVFRGGERLGSVLFHLANGYVEAFIFTCWWSGCRCGGIAGTSTGTWSR